MDMAYPFRGACTPPVSGRSAAPGRWRVRLRGSGSSAWGSGSTPMGSRMRSCVVPSTASLATPTYVRARPRSETRSAPLTAVSKFGSPRWPDSRHDRYYECAGLLPPPDRTESGYTAPRRDNAVERLRFIRGAQSIGLRLQEIKELLDIRDRGLCPSGHTEDLLRRR